MKRLVEFLLKNHGKTFFAVMGITFGILSIDTSFIFNVIKLVPVEQAASAINKGSVRMRGKGVVEYSRGWLGYENPKILFTEQLWSWEVPSEIEVGSDASLTLKREIIARYMEASLALKLHVKIDPKLSQNNIFEEEKPLNIIAEGDFVWLSPQYQTSRNLWHWVFTATRRGNKIIQLVLPDSLASYYQVADSSKRNLGVLKDNYLTIPIFVSGPFGLSEDTELLLKSIAGFIGFIFTAPLIVGYLKSKRAD